MNHKHRILIVDDDGDIREPIAFVLQKKGFTVELFEKGEDALYVAIQTIPNIIILDLLLPGMSGEEVCKAIRENDDETVQKIPIIMLSAKRLEVDRIVGRVIGANCYLTKPFEIEVLLRVVNRLIGNPTEKIHMPEEY